MSIRQLPDTLINQIAAGEVVERPASVVKELVENALDAGARRIDIDLEEGGVRLIRIRDDGGGIDAAELPLAVSRHATSKIASIDDLESVATLGFRGEALPSVASVSRFRLSSRRNGSEHGAVLQVEGGRVGEVAPHPHPPGTTVEVRDLFYNVPARRKFLRAERTELSHVEEWLRSLALARPDVEIRVSHNGKPSRRWKGEGPLQNGMGLSDVRLHEALGEEFARSLARQFTRTMFFGTHGTSLPLETNSVSIDPSLKDAWGLPCMRITYQDHPDDLKTAEFLGAKALEIAQAAGALKTWPTPVAPQTQSVHMLGTCRMGNDPKSSVIDRFHRAHDVRNLFICDGSSLVTSTRGQPTETICALAFRAGEKIAEFAKRGEI